MTSTSSRETASAVAWPRPLGRLPHATAIDPRTEAIDVFAETLWTMLVSGGLCAPSAGRTPRTIDSPQRGRADAGNGDRARSLELLGPAEDASIRTGRAR